MADKFFSAFDYKFYAATATTSADSHPTSSSGLTQIVGLTDAGIQVSTDTVDVVDYSSTAGFKKSLATAQSYSISCELNIDTTSTGYQLLKDASLAAVSGTFLKFYRESPDHSGVNVREKHAGIVQVTNFSEDIKSGGIAKCTFTLSGYGSVTYTKATADA
jgi:predicted secreted protein